MAEFRKIPDLRIGDEYQWVTVGDLEYWSDVAGELIVVPSGFETDLASIPRWVPRWLIDVNGKHRTAAIPHDYLCRHRSYSRVLADRVFREALVVCEEAKWRSWMMYTAVSLNTAWLAIRRRKN